MINTVAASQTSQALNKTTAGATGGAGDRLDFLLIVPASTSPGSVTIQDGNSPTVTVFTGGASSVSNLVPFPVPVGEVSRNGPWKITTGASVSAAAFGDFS